MSVCQAETAVPQNRLGELKISLPVSRRLFMKRLVKLECFKFFETHIQTGAYTVLLHTNLNCLFSSSSSSKVIYLTVSSLLVKKKKEAFPSWTV